MPDVSKIKLPDNSELNIKDARIPGVDSTPTSGSSNLVTSGGIHTAIVDTELVVATALNDLNDRVSDLEDGAETLESDSVWEAGTGTNSVIVKTSGGTAGGSYSTVEGKGSVTGGTHSSYDLTPDTADTTAGSYAHAEGRYTIACGKQGCHAEGDRTLATSQASHAEGVSTIASGNYSHAEGGLTAATGGGSHAEGRGTTASGSYSHAEGQGSVSSGARSHAGGYYSIAIGSESYAEGDRSIAIGQGSHSESLACAYGWKSHAETGNKGIDVFPVGAANVTSYTSIWDAEFDPVRNAIGDTALCNIIKGSAILTKSATAMNPIIITDASLSNNTLSFTLEKTLSDTALDGSVNYWIIFSVAYGDFSHTENSGNVSYGEDSHAEGNYNVALGKDSHAEGFFTFTNNKSEHAEGSYNSSTKTSTTYGNAGNTQHSIGIGTSSARKNALEIMQNGDAYLYGIGTYDGTNYSSATTIQDVINGKQEALVSGTNLKTINNESLLGSGDIPITGSGDANVIEAITFNGTSATINSSTKTAAITAIVPKVFTGTCATAGDTTTKVVTCPEFTAGDLVVGTKIFVTFDNTNSGAVASLKMNVNGTGDKRLQKLKSSSVADLSVAGEIIANVTYLFVYNGTAWVCMTMDYNSNTTYASMTVAEYQAGTGTGARSITPERLKGAIDYWRAQQQVDWGQSDNTAVDYIKNKPTIPDAVEANPTIPSGTTPTTLSNLKVGSNYYSVSSGGGGTVGALVTNNTTAQVASASESFSGTINLHKVAKTGTYSDLIGTPTISSNVATDKADNTKVTGAKAVYDEIHPAIVTTQPAGGFEPNVLYELGTLTGTVTFTMASPTDATIINHYYWTFETSSTAPTITWPSGVTSWFGGSAPTVSASKHYEISILDGVGCFMEV